MSIITVEHISKIYGEKRLYDDCSLGIDQHDKIGIIGINGTGKSTLLRIISGLEEADSGQIVKASRIKIASLAQIPEFPKDLNIVDCCLAGLSDMADGWNMDAKAREMLNILGFNDFTKTTDKMSGGEKKKVALVATLIQPSDVLILDEPTNHLDMAMINWLEDYLKSYRGAIIMVTHDRYFLDKVCHKIVEIDDAKLYTYETNYSGFLEAKNRRIEEMIASEQKRQNFLRNELVWVRRGAQARSTKQKARLARFEAVKNEKPRDSRVTDTVQMDSIATRMGKKTIEISHISKKFGQRTLIDDFTYFTERNDRVGVVGSNGCGKSTLLKLIVGLEEVDSGSIERGETLSFGYLSQEMDLLKKAGDNTRVIDYIRDTAEFIRTRDGLISAAKMLERFLFEGKVQYSPIGKLSGGEKRRLMLLKVLMEAPNVLVLDEPTNDLDIATLSIFEDFLEEFEGIVITVSHDRYFLDNVVDKIFAFEDGGKIVRYDGNYTDYVEKSGFVAELKAGGSLTSTKEAIGGGADAAMDATKGSDSSSAGKASSDDKASAGPGSANTNGHEDKPKFTYMEKKEFETIDSDIEKAEEEVAELDEAILKAATDFVKLAELTKKKDETEARLEELYSRWEYLNELNEKILAYNASKN